MEDSFKFYVYALIDPRTNKPFYIGRGTWINQRHLDHLMEYHQWVELGRFKDNRQGWNLEKIRIIKNIIESGLEIKYEFIFKSDCLHAATQTEGRVIKTLKLRRLTNKSPGGFAELSFYNRPIPKKNSNAKSESKLQEFYHKYLPKKLKKKKSRTLREELAKLDGSKMSKQEIARFCRDYHERN